MSIRNLVLISCFVLSISLPAVPGAAPLLSLLSAWRTSPFAADGVDGDWTGTATPLSGGPVAVGVMNDGEFLYLRVRAFDRGAQMQLLFGGLTVWFDPNGGDKKTFGIRYPVGSPLPAPRSRGNRPASRPASGPEDQPAGGGRGEPTGEPGARGGPVVPADMSEVVPRRLEVLGPGKDEARSLVLDHADGISVALGRNEGVLIYELRVPLKKNADLPYAIGADPGAVIGVGFDSPKMKRERPPETEASGGRGGGAGGPSGGGIGGIGGMGRGGPMGMGRGGPEGGGPSQLPESAKPWKTWIKVQLARPNAAGPGVPASR
jgi:hypothetical protein